MRLCSYGFDVLRMQAVFIDNLDKLIQYPGISEPAGILFVYDLMAAPFCAQVSYDLSRIPFSTPFAGIPPIAEITVEQIGISQIPHFSQ